MGDDDRPCRLLLLPKIYSGESNFDNWISHFKTVASINEWNDATKQKWMSVRISGHAQTAIIDFWKKHEQLMQLPKEHYWNNMSHLQ